jgi:hypothetical protein
MAVGEQVRRTVGDAVAVSIGAALSVDVDGGGEALWQQASACLDAAKAAGRDQVVVHQPA